MMKITLKDFLNESNTNYITVYHGTNTKFVDDIKKNGLIPKITSANWYMVSTDFESALFHAIPQENSEVYIFEFKIPINNNKPYWEGYPYLWKAYKRTEKSTWYALMDTLTPNMIVDVHKVPYEKWSEQKIKKF